MNSGNGSINSLGPNSQGGRFSGLPPDEYSAMPMYRSLNYSHPVEAYTRSQLTYKRQLCSDYVAVMRNAALPIHNYMSKKAKHELVHSMLARQWGITSQVQFNGLVMCDMVCTQKQHGVMLVFSIYVC
jgi:hypothetical protein